MVPMLDAETGKTILVNTNSKEVRTNYRAYYLKTVDYFQNTFTSEAVQEPLAPE